MKCFYCSFTADKLQQLQTRFPPFKFEKIPTVLSCTAEKGPKPDWERRSALNACKGGDSAREGEIDGKRERRRRRRAQNCAGWNVWWVHFLFSQVTMTGRFNFFNRTEINQTIFLVGVFFFFFFLFWGSVRAHLSQIFHHFMPQLLWKWSRSWGKTIEKLLSFVSLASEYDALIFLFTSTAFSDH